MAQSLRFGHFEIRCDQRQLLVGGMPAALGSRAFDLLRALVERRERLVSKEELLELVWPGVIVEENNLQVQISALRKLLGTQVIVTIPGRGYQFTAAPIDASVSSATAASAHGASLAHGNTGPRGHLLVAEDNKVNRLLLCRTLELMGHHVAGVDNGRKALEALRRERHDLLLLDLPVIVTSSVEGVAQVARCIELGADDFLHKPVNPVLLRARVGSSLEKRRLREQQKALIQRLSAAVPTPHAAGALRATEARRGNATVLAVRLRGRIATEALPSPGPMGSGGKPVAAFVAADPLGRAGQRA